MAAVFPIAGAQPTLGEECMRLSSFVRRGRRPLVSILLVCMMVLGLSAVHAEARESNASHVYINAKAAVVLDADSGRLLYEKHADEPLYPASTTKLMTAILLIEYLHLDDPIYISPAAARQPRVRLGLKPDTYITADQALHAIIMKSANDVAYAVAETIGGSQLGFARMMNVKARLLGCTHTNFVTPNGLHEDEHRSSAYDIARILSEAVKHPEIVKAMQTKEYTIANKTFRNGNRFIYLSESPFGEIIGGKTGYTSKAMYCLAFAARQHGKVRVSVVLGAPRKSAMYRETRRLLQFAAENRSLQLV
jgi:D-alanyl-D-alanine carboxypeptidase